MNTTEIESKIQNIIIPFCKNTEAVKTLKPETRILEDLGVNSARLVDIILAFEDEFGVAIDDASADRVRTYGDAVAMIAQMLPHA